MGLISLTSARRFLQFLRTGLLAAAQPNELAALPSGWTLGGFLRRVIYNAAPRGPLAQRHRREFALPQIACFEVEQLSRFLCSADGGSCVVLVETQTSRRDGEVGSIGVTGIDAVVLLGYPIEKLALWAADEGQHGFDLS